MMLIVVVLALWAYVVVGFIALALASASPYFMDRAGAGALVGIILILLWPIVIGQTISRARRFARARREIIHTKNGIYRVFRAYEILGQRDGDQLMKQIAMECAAEQEARNG